MQTNVDRPWTINSSTVWGLGVFMTVSDSSRPSPRLASSPWIGVLFVLQCFSGNIFKTSMIFTANSTQGLWSTEEGNSDDLLATVPMRLPKHEDSLPKCGISV